MLNTIVQSHFEDLIGQRLSIDFVGDASTEVEVVSTKALGMRGPREAFSVLFRDAGGAHHPQRIYPVHHPTLGELGLFLVPIGPDAQGMLYEAVFA